jgi:CRISPR-associated protein Cas5t
MLLSLVGESSRYRHEGVKLAFAYKDLPKPVTTIRKISGSKYREHDNQHGQPGTPEHIETLCDIVFLCWIDSSSELRQQDLKLETRSQ